MNTEPLTITETLASVALDAANKYETNAEYSLAIAFYGVAADHFSTAATETNNVHEAKIWSQMAEMARNGQDQPREILASGFIERANA
jgi:hypothetical protein